MFQGKLPKNAITHNGDKWFFVGSVHIKLGKLLDGQTITDETAQTAMDLHEKETICCTLPKRRRVKSRIFPSKESAINAAHDLKLTVS